ncbi:protein FAM53A isoform X2 [Bos javanicus]|uniref:protein FAM53A isoform X2 n=1 Tax=Bos javanicus TaxID=9906 RepID=UPI002AA7AF75|nr:protein FAM53A isoform X2 [Bos javanicus]
MMHSAQKLSRSGHSFPFETNSDTPWEVVGGGRPVRCQVAAGPASPSPPGPRGPSVGALSTRDLRAAPAALSAAHQVARPLPVGARRAGVRRAPEAPRRPQGLDYGHQEALPQKQECLVAGPRPPGHQRRLAPCALAAPGLGGPPEGDRTPSPRRCLSPSQEHLVPEGAAPPSAGSMPAPTPVSTPEPSRCQGLLCCHSQACVRAGGKGRRKRGHVDDARWPSPALDFLKMARVKLPPASGAGVPPSTPPPPPSCSPSSPVLLGALPKDRPTCPCLSVVPGPCGSAGPRAPVCWEMLRGRVPPHSPSPLALACLLGPCPQRVDSCPPRSLSARW